jgi:Uma2 family endonuclease
MAIAAFPPVKHASADAAAQRLMLHDVSWELYEQLLQELGGRPLRLTYDEGSIEFMVPSPEHEEYKKLIAGLLEIIAYELVIPMRRFGSTTLRRKDLEKGLEADEAYYVQSEPQIRGKRKLNLKKDPSPDLVVEVDISYHALNREKIYAAIGVPEVWRFDGTRLLCLHLKRGRYVERAHSAAFPWLPALVVERYTKMLWVQDSTHIIRSFGQWVREHGPRG